MTTITDFPGIRPSLLLDFANSGRVDPRIQFARASIATCHGPEGKLRTVANNVPRVNYDPETGKCLGLLVEEARTNLAYPSNMPTSTVQTTTGVMQANGATKITSGLEAPDGTLTGFSVEGADVSTNSTGANNIRLLAVATAVGTYVLSFWVKAQPGVKVNAREASSAAITQFSPSSSWKRVSATFTTTAANQNIILYSELGARFDVWGVQFEAGAFPTSYIPTSTSAGARAADAPYLSGAIPGFNPDRGTLIVSYDYPADNVANMIPLSLDAGTQANSIALATSGSGIDRFLVQAGGVGVFNSGFTSFAAGIRKTSGITFGGGRISTSSEGKPVVAVAGVAMPAGLNRITLGHSGYFGASRTSGHIARLAYYPVPVTDSQLQRLTA